MYNCCKHHHCSEHDCSSHHCPPHHKPYPPEKPSIPEQPSIPVAPPLPGGWTSWLPPTKEEIQLFYIAIRGLIGVDYTPYAVQSQVIAGKNYLFIAKTEVLTGRGVVIGVVTVAVTVDAQGNIIRGPITPIGN